MKAMTIIFLFFIFMANGCISLSQNQHIKENGDFNKTKNANEILEQLRVFAKATAITEIVNKSIKHNSIAATVLIKEIANYSEFESSAGTLLKNNDTITIEFTGIDGISRWNSDNIQIGDIIEVELRCLDGRINSLKTFTKADCYWEGADETVIVR